MARRVQCVKSAVPSTPGTLGAHAQRGLLSWVCLSVKSHLTYGASVRPENAVTYYEGQKICGNRSVAEIQHSLRCTAMRTVGHFSMRISRVRAWRMRISRHAHGACVFLDTRMIYTPPRVQHFSAFHWSPVAVHRYNWASRSEPT